MTDPIETPPAGTPPAGTPPEGGKEKEQAPPPAGTPATTPGKEPKDFILSQDQFNQRWAEKMAALEKDLGIPIKDAKTLIAEHNKRVEGEKTELQKATEKNASLEDELAVLQLKDTIYSALLKAGAKPEKMDTLALRVLGETSEEIDADVLVLKKDLPSYFGNYAGSGGGHPGVPEGQPGKKTWKRSEVSEILKDPSKVDPKVLDEINLAERERRIDYNS